MAALQGQDGTGVRDNEFATYADLRTQALNQRDTLLFRLLPTSAFKWLTDDDFIDLESAAEERESILSSLTKAITDAEIALWDRAKTLENLQNEQTLFNPEISTVVAEIEADRADFESRCDDIPDSLLTPVEHARLYQVAHRFKVTLDALQAMLRRREAAVGRIRDVIADAQCSVLQAKVVLEQIQTEDRAFSEQIRTAHQMLSECQAEIQDVLKTHPVSAFLPTELSRLCILRIEVSEKKSAFDAILKERHRSVRRRTRARNDVLQATWTTQYGGDRSATPPSPTELTAQLSRLEATVESLQSKIAGTDSHYSTPIEHTRDVAAMKTATERIRQLQEQLVFERRFRAVRRQFTRLVRDIDPYLTTGEYWSETDRRTTQTRLTVLAAQLRAIRVLAQTFENITVDEERVTRVHHQLTAIQSHKRLDIDRFQRLRAETAETLYRRLDDIETLYWNRRTAVEALEQDEKWSHEQRTQTAPTLITTLRCDLRAIDATVSELPSEGVRPDEYGTVQGYRSAIRADLKALQRRLSVERILHTVSDIHEYIESEATPYLNYEELCPESTLREFRQRLTEASNELRALGRLGAVEELPDPIKREVAALSDQVAVYRDHFAQYNQEYVTKRAEKQFERFGEYYTELEDQLQPAKTHGEPLPDGVHSQVEQVRTVIDDLAELTGSPTGKYLQDSHRYKIAQAKVDLRESQQFIDQKEEFDTKLEEHRSAVQHVRSEAEPFLNHERFLTRCTQSELTGLIRDTRSEIEAWQDTFDFSLLANADEQKPDQLIETLVDVLKHVNYREVYNTEFVKAARNRNADLFTNIDEDGNDLTPSQQQAIVRNGVYNQVVAGAGTGKTLALIYRVAYLVSRQGIDPDRIAVVTLTNKATEEIEARLAKRFNITGVQVQTLHSFGLDIVREGASENIEIASGDLRNLLDRLVNDAGHEPFKSHLRQFVQHDQTEYLDEDDFETRADYVAERANKHYLTLAGEEVASRAEKVIADFLFEHQVRYRYEEVAEWAESAAGKKSYEPDFYLPDYDLYIEHWAIDEDGQVPDWFTMSTIEYDQKRRWAREQFESVDATLVETDNSDYEDGTLRERLTEILSKQGVELEPLSFEQLVDRAHEYHETEKRLKDQLAQFVQNAKIFSKTPDEIRDAVADAAPRKHHFAHCGAYALSEYQAFLTRTGRLDFQDMLLKAVTTIEQHPELFHRRFDHLLVDEFQDTSVLGQELINTLVPSGQDDTRLFTVGDDWQSIYGFRGAAVERFVGFEDVFGQAAQTKLTQNHRSPDPVVKAGNELLTNNPNQIAKVVEPAGDTNTEPVLHTLNGKKGSDRDYRQRVGRYVATLVKSFINDGVDADEIMVLCRFDQGARYLNRVKKSLKSERIPFDGEYEQYRPDEKATRKAADGDGRSGVDVQTIHKAKGREAEKVILVHAASGRYGLPADQNGNELLTPARDVEIDRIEEERRLFYVAMTRTKDELHVTTRRNNRSQFIDEVAEWFDERRSAAYPGPDGERTSLTAKVEQLWDPHPTQHQVGLLSDETGVIKFVSWPHDDSVDLEEGHWYRLDELKVNDSDEYGIQVMIDRKTVVEDLVNNG